MVYLQGLQGALLEQLVEVHVSASTQSVCYKGRGTQIEEASRQCMMGRVVVRGHQLHRAENTRVVKECHMHTSPQSANAT